MSEQPITPFRFFSSSGGVSRRRFLGTAARSAAGCCAATLLTGLGTAKYLVGGPAASLKTVQDLLRTAREARYWIAANSPGVNCGSCHTTTDQVEGDRYRHEEKVVRCLLCAQKCMIKPGDRGQCRARANDGGKLKSLVYGHPVSVHVDPIEKKPFYHFLPGSDAFSLATTGCPLSCKFCQNWEISQAKPEDFPTRYTGPEVVVDATLERKAPVIAFTYNEPTVFMEYLADIARLARKRDIYCVLVSCGFMNEKPLDEMCDLLSGIKIDLKGFSKDFYRRVCSAELDPVLRSIKQVKKRGVHLEIVNLVVPTLNDSKQMMTDLCKWVVGELGPDVPVHFTRFHPDYQMLNLPPTPVSTLEHVYDIAKAQGMHYPYVGNVPGHTGNNTICPKCGEVVIGRKGFFITHKKLEGGLCSQCKEPISGVWSPPDLSS